MSSPTITTPLRYSHQVPYAPQLSTISEEHVQDYENTVIRVQTSESESPAKLSLGKKIAKVIIGLGIITIIVLVFVIFVL